MSNYKSRICDAILERKLKGVGAVLLEGPKWCGKTTTCERLAKSVLYMSDPVAKEKNLLLASININELLELNHLLFLREKFHILLTNGR